MGKIERKPKQLKWFNFTYFLSIVLSKILFISKVIGESFFQIVDII